ncbi:hypothetical protein GOODEAATRI_033729 [Goodea atripinnis]|uniref:Uncharacterized protein n=1 Tax=Goodea atripinnis TaxID=208336 RepID=A0ABV0N7R0_9TELE
MIYSAGVRCCGLQEEEVEEEEAQHATRLSAGNFLSHHLSTSTHMRAAWTSTADQHVVKRPLRGLHGSGLHHHLDFVLGARQQLDGSALTEAGSVHLEEDGSIVRLDSESDLDGDDRRDVVHVTGMMLCVLGLPSWRRGC